MAHFVGNAMIDTLERLRGRANAASTMRSLGLRTRSSHWSSSIARNVDDDGRIAHTAQPLADLVHRLPVVFPVHARTRRQLAETGPPSRLESTSGLMFTQPLAYLASLGLPSNARLVLTDSGGIQEETTPLGLPCLTMRTTTERPVTVTEGTNPAGRSPRRGRGARRG